MAEYVRFIHNDKEIDIPPANQSFCLPPVGSEVALVLDHIVYKFVVDKIVWMPQYNKPNYFIYVNDCSTSNENDKVIGFINSKERS
jgi:hypothetical protein